MLELSVLAAADEAPTSDCVIAEGRVWSYADVAGRVRAAISTLRGAGVEGGERVALAPQVDLDSLVWLYALFELGCPAVLLHPRLTDRERRAVLEQAKPAHLISEPVPASDAPMAHPLPDAVPAERALAIIHTSGSRGEARAAVLSRRAFVASEAAHAANLPWVTGDRWLASIPPAHVGGLSILTRCLVARRCVVLESGPFEPARAVHTMEEHRVTLLSIVPTMLQRLIDFGEPAWVPGPALRAVLVGGAPFPKALREKATGRGVPVLATYGCTEACSQVTTQALELSGRPGSGTPLHGVEVRIQAGEIQIRGDVLMDAYLGEDRSGEPWASGAWLRTGDRGRFMPDGQLEVLGRIDDVIITGGENVSPDEVEACLRAVPGVTDACVFALPHDEWGEEVAAALVTDPGRYDRDVLRAHLRENLAPHKRPKRICILGALPLNRSGKVDRRGLAAQCQQDLRPI